MGDALFIALGVVGALLYLCICTRPMQEGMCQDNRSGAAYEALRSPSVRNARNAFDRRVALAIREAKRGFRVCSACGFSNSARAASCVLCGATERKRSWFGRTQPAPRGEASRQRRIRGRVVWRHDAQFVGPALEGFPAYVLQMASHCGRSTLTTDAVAIEIEPSTQHERMICAGLSVTRVHDGDVVQATSDAAAASQLDFPTKLAQFITSMAGLFHEGSPQEEDREGEDAGGATKLSIARSALQEESLLALASVPAATARRAIRVEFIGERGIDAGGVYREWFRLLAEEIVAADAGVFTCVDALDQAFYLNPSSRDVLGADHLQYFVAVGRLLGRALLEGNVTGFHLAQPLLKIVLGLPVSVGDLAYFDPEAFQSLTWLLENDGVDGLCLDFTVVEKRSNGTPHVIELVPGGAETDVTDANKREFVDRRLQYLLFESVAEQLACFLQGVYDVVPREALVLFDAEELDYVLSGSDAIDVDDWESHTVATKNLMVHPSLAYFWKVVRELSGGERCQLLQFATGATRVPPGGFGALTSHDGRLGLFTLRGVKPKSTRGYLYSHACFNRIDLPMHRNLQKMRLAVRAAISSESVGFTTD